MARNMSFSMTTQAIIDRTKTVTRRKGWEHLKPGDLAWAVEKGMGLKKGEVPKRLALIRIKKNDPVVLNDYSILTKEDVTAEGFPKLQPWAFVFTFCVEMGGEPDQELRRIEFEYVPEAEWEQEMANEAAKAANKKKHYVTVPARLRHLYRQRHLKKVAKKRGKHGSRTRLSTTAKIKLLREALARQMGYWMDRVSPQIALEDAVQVYQACKPGVENKCDLMSHGKRP